VNGNDGLVVLNNLDEEVEVRHFEFDFKDLKALAMIGRCSILTKECEKM